MANQNTLLDFEKIIKSLPRGLVIIDQQSNTVFINSNAADLLGFTSPKQYLTATANEIDSIVQVFTDDDKKTSLKRIFHFKQIKDQINSQTFRLYFPQILEERWISIQSNIVVQNGVSVGVFSLVDLTAEKKSQEVLHFINTVSIQLSKTHDHIVQLKTFADLVIPIFADICVIDMLNEQGELETIEVNHIHPSKEKKITQLQSALHHHFKKKQKLVWKVISSGKSESITQITTDLIQKYIKDPVTAENLQNLHLHSAVIVPLIARKKTLGAITFVWAESRKKYSQFDIQSLETICHRVALMTDNAQLFNKAQQEIELQKQIQYQLIEKEMTLQLALKAGNMGVWDWDLEKGIIAWSEGLEKLHGLKKGEFGGTMSEYRKLIHSQDVKQVTHAIEDSIKNSGFFDQEFRIVQPNKDIRWMIGKGKVFHNANGVPVRMVGIAIDNTERRIAEERLRLSERKFKSVFETSMDGIIIADRTGKIIDANKAAELLFDISKQGLITKHLSSLIHINGDINFEVNWKNLQETGEGRGEFEIRKDENTVLYIEYNASAEVLPNRTLLMLRDITERKVEQQRQEHFLGIASHELKNPLASIKAFVQLLRRYLGDVDNVRVHQYLEKVDNKVDSLAHLINDLLDITRIKHGKLEFYFEFFQFNEVLADVIEDIQVTLKTHTISYTGLKDIEVMGDKNRITQVIQNLIRNAIKYSPNADKVKIRVSKNDGFMRVAIQDFGIGINPNELKKVFHLYYRGLNHSTDNITGLGVGLYISSQIVKQHGGKIWARSEENKGTTFFFTLPLYHSQEGE